MHSAAAQTRGTSRRTHGPTLASLLSLLLIVAGCAAPVHRQAPQLRREAGPPTIIVMPLDVELAQLTAGGLQEPQAEWTEAAHRHIWAALEEEARARQVKLVRYDPDRGDPADRDASLALVALHRAVGTSAFAESVGLMALPTHHGKFEWSLGPSVEAISRSHGADYAIFVYVRDSYATSGRVALIVAAALFGVGVPGGSQIGFASLVDLKTGDIAWFKHLARGTGDLRTPAAATETVKVLIADALR